MTERQELVTRVPSAQELAEQAGIKTERLHAGHRVIPAGQVLFPKEQSIREYGLNGDVLAVITLPKGEDEDAAKEIAVLDVGEIPEGQKVPIYVIHGQEMPGAGYTGSRYGLYPLNYGTGSARFHAVLHPNDPVVLGRNDHHKNAVLGLAHGMPGTGFTSREHLTVKLAEDGSLDLEDHSTHGTTVKYRDVAQESVAAVEAQPALAEMTTEEALRAITQALEDVMRRRPDYYQNYDPKSPQESRQESTMRALDALKAALASHDDHSKYKEVELFSGTQSRDVSLGREHQNNAVLEDLYATLSELAGLGLKDYYDIRETAEAAKAGNNVVMASSPYKYLMDLPAMALTSSRNELCGVQLRLAPNIFATFVAENLLDETRPHNAEVRLAVVAGK